MSRALSTQARSRVAFFMNVIDVDDRGEESCNSTSPHDSLSWIVGYPAVIHNHRLEQQLQYRGILACSDASSSVRTSGPDGGQTYLVASSAMKSQGFISWYFFDAERKRLQM